MANSEVEICNIAITKIGHEGFINSLSEDSKAARVMNYLYAPMRDVVLRSHLWRFARKRAALAPLTDSVAFDGGKYFQIPSDCLRVVGTDRNYQYGRWIVEGDKILSDATTMNIVYIAQITNVALMDPLFVDALAAKLAYEGCMAITKDATVKNAMAQEYKMAVMRAAHASATEVDGDKFISEAFISFR